MGLGASTSTRLEGKPALDDCTYDVASLTLPSLAFSVAAVLNEGPVLDDAGSTTTSCECVTCALAAVLSDRRPVLDDEGGCAIVAVLSGWRPVLDEAVARLMDESADALDPPVTVGFTVCARRLS